MTPTTLTMKRGDAQTWGFLVTDEDGILVVDITGAPIRFTVKERVADLDADAIVAKTVGAGITITDGPAGRLTVQLAAADTDSLAPPLTLLWDLQVVDSVGPHTVAYGSLIVSADISRTAP